MKTIRYEDICTLDGTFANVFTYQQVWNLQSVYDYERAGRQRHMIYYQIEGERRYFRNGELLATARKGDVLFMPDGARYYTDVPELYESGSARSSGAGISFDLLDREGTPIAIDEQVAVVAHDDAGDIYRLFRQLMQTFLHPDCTMLFNGTLFLLLDRVFSGLRPELRSPGLEHQDIMPAVAMIERHPERSLSNRELAALCYISEASFLRKFKAYSGGITPMQYRNRLRLTMAEELTATSKSLQEIAEMLGFYDAPHLCRTYRQHRGRTLRKEG